MDSLRAIAALSVLFFHLAGYAALSSDTRVYTTRLNVGVTIFFLISGFLLYRPFVVAHVSRRQGRAPGPYAWRRALRIVPAYWVALVVSAVVLGRDEVFGPNGLLYFAFSQVYDRSTALGGIAQAWTIDVEIVFYTFLPLWAWAVRRAARRSVSPLRVEAIGLGILVLVGLLYKLTVVFPSGDVPSLAFSLPRFIDQFALGMGLAVLSVALEGRQLPRPLRAIDRWPALGIAFAAVAFWVASTQIGLIGATLQPLDNGQRLELHYLFALVAVGLLLPAVFGDQRRGAVRRILGWRGLLWVGVISYSVYLYHGVVLRELADWSVPHDIQADTGLSSFLAWTVVALPFALLVAAVSYYLIERPALSLKQRLPTIRGEPAGGSGALALVGGVLLVVAALAGPPAREALALGVVGTGAIMLALGCLTFRLRRPGLVASVLVSLGAVATIIAGFGLAGPTAQGRPSWTDLGVGPRVHLVGTVDAGRLTLFVNGRERASTRLPRAPERSTTPIYVGAYGGYAVWSGRIDEVALYADALTPNQVASHYRVGTTRGPEDRYAAAVRATAGLSAYFRLDEAQGPARSEVGRKLAGRYDPRVGGMPLG